MKAFCFVCMKAVKEGKIELVLLLPVLVENDGTTEICFF